MVYKTGYYGLSAGIVHIGSSELFLGNWIQKNHSSLSRACQNFHEAYCLTRLWLLTIEVSSTNPSSCGSLESTQCNIWNSLPPDVSVTFFSNGLHSKKFLSHNSYACELTLEVRK